MEVGENNFGSGGDPGHLDKFIKIMSDLLNDVMDHFQVMELAKTFSVNFLIVRSFSRHKSLLLKFVLE
jgi:hypothetical protein